MKKQLIIYFTIIFCFLTANSQQYCNIDQYYFEDVCVNCNQTIPGCQFCQIDEQSTLTAKPIKCNQCTAPGEGFDPITYTCKSCNMSNCQFCTFEASGTQCRQCLPGFFINDTICQSCGITNCQMCSQQYNSNINQTEIMCFDCGNGSFFNETSHLCTQCSNLIPGCANCQLFDRKPYCNFCEGGKSFIPELNQCFDCNATFPGCQECFYDNTTSTPQVACKYCGNYNQGFSFKTNKCEDCQIFNQYSNCQNCAFDTFGKEFCHHCYQGSYFSTQNQSCLKCGIEIENCYDCAEIKLPNSNLTQLKCLNCQYNMGFDPVTEKCLSCDQVMPGCQRCSFDSLNGTSASNSSTSGFLCLDCGWGSLYLPETQTCQKCSAAVDYCDYCYLNNTTIVCNQCMQGYQLINDTCQQCNQYVQGCQGCYMNQVYDNNTYQLSVNKTHPITCYYCGEGKFFNDQKYTCDLCENLVSDCDFCHQDYYNKSQIICDDCGIGRYFSTITYACLNCSSKISGCLRCGEQFSQDYYNNSTQINSSSSKEVICFDCGYGMGFNKLNNSCLNCSQLFNGCENCGMTWTQAANETKMTCFSCSWDSYFNQIQNTCLKCDSKVPGCQRCSIDYWNESIFQCYDCGYMNAYDEVSKSCLPCSQIIPGCVSCGKSWNYQTYKDEMICFDCGFQNFYNPQKKTCDSCQDYLKGCQGCQVQQDYSSYPQPYPPMDSNNSNITSPSSPPTAPQMKVMCYYCGQGLFFDMLNNMCISCEDKIPGCGGCGMTMATPNYPNYPTTDFQNTTSSTSNNSSMSTSYQLQCFQCLNENKNFNPKTNTCEYCTIRENCYKCNFDMNGQEFCQDCFWGYYFNNKTKQCSKCSDKINGCQNCRYDESTTSGIYCYSCEYSQFFNESVQMCKNCSDYFDGCIGCNLNYFNQKEVNCYDCGYGKFFNSSSQQCLACKNFITGCNGCNINYMNSSEVMCYDCGVGSYFNESEKACQNCSVHVPGCVQCGQNYMNKSQVMCYQCEPGKFFDEFKMICDRCGDYITDCESCFYFVPSPSYSNGSTSSNNMTKPASPPQKSQLICTSCMYGQTVEDNRCLDCNSKIPGCLYCSNVSTPFGANERYCYNCGEQDMYFSISNKSQCMKCSDRVRGCQGCYENYRWDYKYMQMSNNSNSTSSSSFSMKITPEMIEFNCYSCGQGNFYNNASLTCDSCSAVIPNCQNCFFDHWSKKKLVCLDCVPGMYFDSTFDQCISCSSKFPGCQSCYAWFDYMKNSSEISCFLCLPGFAIDYENRQCVKTNDCEDNCDICKISGRSSIQETTTSYSFDAAKNVLQEFNKTTTKESLSTQCERCRDGFILTKDFKCIFDQQCSEGKFYNGTHCDYCYNQISECFLCNRVNGSNLTCGVCFNDFNLSRSGQCLPSKGTLNCPPGCKNCTFQKDVAVVQCSSCMQNYILDTQSHSCMLNCSSLGFQNCDICVKFVDEKTNFTQAFCKQCAKEYTTTADGKCSKILSCGENKTFFNANASCINCPDNCLGCRDISMFMFSDAQSLQGPTLQCDYCKRGYILSEDGLSCRYFDDTTMQCPGIPFCNDCTYNSVSHRMTCTKCESPFIPKWELDIYNQDEYSICGIQCTQSSCDKCYLDSELNITICTHCISNFLLNQAADCVQQWTNCSTLQYFDPNSKTCQNCLSGCQRCQFSEFLQSSQCLFCQTDYKLTLDSNCIQKTNANESSCPEGKYQEIGANICQDCPANCAFCSFDGVLKKAICQQCMYGFIYTRTMGCVFENTLSKQGIVSCKEGQYSKSKIDPSDNLCYDCGINCLNCVYDETIGSDRCLKCVNDVEFFLTKLGLCVNKICPEGTIFNTEIGCEECPPFCRRCQRNTTAGVLQCQVNFCVKGYERDSSTLQCKFNTSSCLAGQVAVSNSCQDCPYNCERCSASNPDDLLSVQCDQCASGFKLEGTQYCKKDSCKATQYYGYSFTSWVMDCYDCPSSCSACSFNYLLNKVQCSACAADFILEGLWCERNTSATVLSCNKGEMAILDASQTFKCEKCPPSCTSCAFDEEYLEVVCDQCITNFILKEHRRCAPDTKLIVAIKCPDASQTFNYITKQCEACPIGCSSCRQGFADAVPEIACTNCIAGFTWNTDWKCIKNCGKGEVSYFVNKTTQACRKCSIAKCATCDIDNSQSQPEEICYQCQSGYFQKDKICVANPVCPDATYLIIESSSFMNYTAQCQKCPEGCLACKAQDSSDPYSKVTCSKCNTTSHTRDSTSGACIINIFSANKDVDCGVNQGLYKYFESTKKKHICGQCPDGCSSCEGHTFCMTCKDGYYLQKTGTKQLCTSLPSCNQKQYYSMNRQQCQDCPFTCSACRLADLTNDESIVCSSCNSGYNLSGTFMCLKALPDSDNELNAALCNNQNGVFPAVIDGLVQCFDCPYACETCHLNNPRKPETSLLNCTVCKKGYEINSVTAECVAKCQFNEYFDQSLLLCAACHYSCHECLDATAACLVCNEGYEFNSQGICTDISVGSGGQGFDSLSSGQKIDCGIYAYYDAIADYCICQNSNELFNALDGSCKSISSYSDQCSMQQYYDSEISACLPCKSANSDGVNRCSMCTGPLATDCLECITGYFLDISDYSCTACTAGCQQCSSTQTCNRCQDGFYRFSDIENGVPLTKCYAKACPSGSLPFLISLYYLNPSMFSETELEEKLAMTEESIKLESDTNYAVAVDAQYGPIFDNLPWQKDKDDNPIYKGQKVNLECVPCRDHCKECISSELYIPDQKICYAGEYCPGDYVIQQVGNKRVCTMPQQGQFAISFIDRPTLTLESGIQPLKKALYIDVSTTQDNQSLGNLTYQWSVMNAKLDSTGLLQSNPSAKVTELDNSKVKKLKSKFFEEVAINKRSLSVPASNLQQFVTYTVRVVITLSYNGSNRQEKLQEDLNITVRNVPQFRKTEDLGVKADLIEVEPKSGVSGETKFKAKYSICNTPAYTRPPISSGTWKFAIEIEQGKNITNNSTNETQSNSFQLSSTSCSDSIEFMVPASRKKDQNIEIKFAFSFGENYYQTVRKIKATANPTFKLSGSSAIKKISQAFNASNNNKTAVLKDIDLALGASQIQSDFSDKKQSCPSADDIMKDPSYLVQGPCNASVASPCCGNGVCSQISGTLRYECVCNKNYTGIFCNVEMDTESRQNLQELIAQVVGQLKGQNVNTKNVGTILSTINSVAKTQTLNSTIVTDLLNQLKSASSFVGDSKTLTTVLETIQELQKSQLSKNVSSNENQTLTMQRSTLETMTNAVLSNAKSLSKSNPETSFSSGSITGKNILVSAGTNSNSNSGSNTIQVSMPSSSKSEQLNIGINKTIMGDLKEVAVSTVVSSSSLISSAKGGKTVASDNLEINLVQPSSGNKLIVKNLTGECPIRFVMQAKSVNKTNPNNSFQCVYLDSNNTYSTDGCSVNATKKLGNGTYQVTCCCNHLSLFTTKEIMDDPTPTSTTTTTKPNTNNNNTNTNTSPQTTITGNNAKNDNRLHIYFAVLICLFILSYIV